MSVCNNYKPYIEKNNREQILRFLNHNDQTIFSDIYNNNPKQNFASVNAGDHQLYVGGGQINAEFAKMINNSRVYSKCNEYIKQKYQNENKNDTSELKLVEYDAEIKKEIIDMIEHTYYMNLNTEYTDINKEYERNGGAYFGIAIYKFKTKFPCGNLKNKWMIYINSPDYNKFSNNVEDFYDQYINYTKLLGKAITDYNTKVDEKIEIIRLCFYSSENYRGTADIYRLANNLYENIVSHFIDGSVIVEFPYVNNPLNIFIIMHNNMWEPMLKNPNVNQNIIITQEEINRIFNDPIKTKKIPIEEEKIDPIKQNYINELIKRHVNVLYKINEQVVQSIGEITISDGKYKVGIHMKKYDNENKLYKIPKLDKLNNYFAQSSSDIIEYEYLPISDIMNRMKIIDITLKTLNTTQIKLEKLTKLISLNLMENIRVSEHIMNQLKLKKMYSKQDIITFINSNPNNICSYVIPLIIYSTIEYNNTNDIIDVYDAINKNETIKLYLPYKQLKEINKIIKDNASDERKEVLEKIKTGKEQLEEKKEESGGYKLFPNVNNSDLAIFYLHYYNELNKALKPNKKLYAAFLKKMKSIVKNKEKHINHMKYAYETPNDFNAKYGGDIKITSFKRLITKLESLDKKNKSGD